eukprot:SAG11_NODE_483_length_9069_cov_31.093534_5_plen_875_part_00
MEAAVDAILAEDKLEQLLLDKLQHTRQLYSSVEGLHQTLLRLDGVRPAAAESCATRTASPAAASAVGPCNSVLGLLPLEILLSDVASRLDGASLARLGGSCGWLRSALHGAQSEMLFRRCVVQEFIPPDWIPSLPILTQHLARSRWRNTYRGLYRKVYLELPRLERVLKTLRVLRTDPRDGRDSNAILLPHNVGREVLQKRMLCDEVHVKLSRKCSELRERRAALEGRKDEWQTILDDPTTKHHCRDTRQDMHRRVASSEKNQARLLQAVGAWRKRHATVYTGVHDLLRKTYNVSLPEPPTVRRRTLNALQILGMRLAQMLAEMAQSDTTDGAELELCYFEGCESADWPERSLLQWGRNYNADVSALAAVEIQSAARGATARRARRMRHCAACAIQRSVRRKAVKQVPAPLMPKAATAASAEPSAEFLAQAPAPAPAPDAAPPTPPSETPPEGSGLRYDAGLGDAAVGRSAKRSQRKQRRRRQRKNRGLRSDSESDAGTQSEQPDDVLGVGGGDLRFARASLPPPGTVAELRAPPSSARERLSHGLGDGGLEPARTTFRLVRGGGGDPVAPATATGKASLSPMSALQVEFEAVAKQQTTRCAAAEGEEGEEGKDEEKVVFGDFDEEPELLFGDFGPEDSAAAAAAEAAEGRAAKDATARSIGFESYEKIGNELYALISRSQPVMAAKITGMLLENELEELQALLVDPEELSLNVEQAVRVLRETMLVEQHWAHLITQPAPSPPNGTTTPPRAKPSGAKTKSAEPRTPGVEPNAEIAPPGYESNAAATSPDSATSLESGGGGAPTATVGGSAAWLLQEQEHMARCFYTQEEYERYVFASPLLWAQYARPSAQPAAADAAADVAAGAAGWDWQSCL